MSIGYVWFFSHFLSHGNDFSLHVAAIARAILQLDTRTTD